MARRLSTYADLGVSHGKEEVHAATRKLDKGLFPGAFCQVRPDTLTGSKKHGLIIHADGAGTKSSLAYVYWKETGDVSVFEGIAQDSVAMNIDDMLCVGATGRFLKVNTIGRNAKTVPGEVLDAIISGYSKVVDKLAGLGVQIDIGGGETADVGDLVRTLIVDSTLITRMNLKKVIDCSQVQPGHVIIALASDGQATYEDKPNSGMGSNGLTAARHLLFCPYYTSRYPESFDPALGQQAYQGLFQFGTDLPRTDLNLGQAVLSPTRIYAPVMKRVIKACRPAISAIFHNTGGGQAKCLKFGGNAKQGVSYDKLEPLPMPPLFRLLAQETRYPPEEMTRTFNLGSRMEVICDPAAASEVLDIAHSFNITAKVVGEVTPFTPGQRRLRLGGHWGRPLVLTAACG